ncbi:hypothetical protein BDV95DRAFT_622091 [Massariosphaeria phaeospora]|uniref:Uncharacterized protein n=1 Tax=Massariosphaeria phaeospora TaxID=100035 RepID=A0A7C8M3Y7_9PLEO|nr:hypothetical protein BDV95DRAFT_622091 [Massariosphaeria phaeospora]
MGRGGLQLHSLDGSATWTVGSRERPSPEEVSDFQYPLCLHCHYSKVEGHPERVECPWPCGSCLTRDHQGKLCPKDNRSQQQYKPYVPRKPRVEAPEQKSSELKGNLVTMVIRSRPLEGERSATTWRSIQREADVKEEDFESPEPRVKDKEEDCE